MNPIRVKTLSRVLGILLLPLAGLTLLVGISEPVTSSSMLQILLPAALFTAAVVYLLLGAPHLAPALNVALDRVIENRMEPGKIFVQTGGARCGNSFWSGWNCTFPLAKLRVTRDAIVLSALFG